MAIQDYAKYDALGLAELVANRDVTAGELVEEAISRAEAVNPKINAIAYKAYDAARESVKRGLPKGPFTGVPFFLKDIFAFATDMPTRQGTAFMPPIPWGQDSTLTARFRQAGLAILGKTNVPEFGLVPTTESRLYGSAHNPFNLDYSTGGSSGGSAALVAASVVPMAHANDGGGSIRIPASCCGLVGLKPTRGRVSYGPDFGDVVDGLAIDLVVSRTVRDSAAILDAVAGNVQGDPYWAPPQPASYLDESKKPSKQLRIAFTTKTLDGKAVHPDCAAAVEKAAKLCQSLGHIVEEASPSVDLSALFPAFIAVWAANLAAPIDMIAQLTGQTPSRQLFEGLTWGIYEMGSKVTASEYLRAKGLMAQATRTSARFHETYDMWLTPTLATPPVKLGTIDMEETDAVKVFASLTDYVPFTPIQNATGQPAINVPLTWNADNLPIGVQFVGRFGDEAGLLRLAAQLEKAAPWAGQYAKTRVN
jgi:amidase